MTPKPLKKKRCRECKAEFMPFRPLQHACSPDCALNLARKKGAAKQRKQLVEGREKLKTLTDYKNEAQTAFNKFIRARDGNVCITCGTTNPNIQYAAGHYRTVKAASQHRYNEDNVHTQCNYACNSVKAGNIAAYRPALINKIGLERVLAIENNNSEIKYTVEELKQIKTKYNKLTRELKKGLSN
jgi:hypothetical protein